MTDTYDQDLERLKKAARELGEFFDSVQIFCTRHDSNEGGTVTVKHGTGNWFSRYGQVREWLLIEEEASRCNFRKDDAE